LGIGANTAIFSTTKAVLLDPLTAPHPERLRLLQWQFPESQPMYSLSGDLVQTNTGATASTSFSFPIYQALKEHAQAFEGLTAFDAEPRQLVANVNGNAERVPVLLVAGTFFQVFRAGAAVGRTLLPSDDERPGGEAVADISDAYWAQRFGRSPAAVGRTIEVNRIPVTIVGVVAASFDGPGPGARPEIYLPLSMDAAVDPFSDPLVAAGMSGSQLTDGERWWLAIMGRLKPGVSDERALASLAPAFAHTVQATLGNHHSGVDRLKVKISAGNRGLQPLENEFSQTASVLMLVVALELLLACANLANLLLARASARKRELGLRIALGAGRARILQQVLTESITAALLGGVAGLFLGYVGRNLVPHMLQRDERVSFDWQVMAFTFGISLLTGLLFGGAPAWQATLTDLQAGLQQASRSTPTRAISLFGKTLVVAQVCLSAVLLIGAGLFLRTLRNLAGSQLGFRPEHLILFDVTLPQTEYKTEQSRAGVFRRLQDGMAAVPGVQMATFSEFALLAGSTSTTNFDRNDEKPAGRKAWQNVVASNYFDAMGIPIVAGRSFGSEDVHSKARAAIINLRLARELFAGEDPIGKTFNDEHIRVVGICADTKFKDLWMDPPPAYYLLYDQRAASNHVAFALRTTASPGSLRGAIQRAVRLVNSQLPITDLRTQGQQIENSLAQERLFAALTSSFGLLALLLAGIGIYGTTAFTVSRRTNEIGIRMALGARRGQILRMISGQACGLAIIGVALASAISLIMGDLLRHFLYGLRASDPATLGAALAVLVMVAFAASWLPARKAASVDPMQALRHE
jgi:predicted permease